jgi:hypothetical protein
MCVNLASHRAIEAGLIQADFDKLAPVTMWTFNSQMRFMSDVVFRNGLCVFQWFTSKAVF